MTDDQTIAPRVGVAEMADSGVMRLLAPNPSAMTYWGTNTYLVGNTTLAVIDPGPESNTHLAALVKAIGGRRVEAILVTHSHLDHSPLARPLARITGAPVLAYGDSLAGRSEMMCSLAATLSMGGGEGVDNQFFPDQTLCDGETIHGADWSLEALHTPGHFGNHLCFALGDTLFTGDHVMGWASSLVSPPDGDLTDFMASCVRLSKRSDRLYLPAHGAPVKTPLQRLNWLIEHRKQREQQILDALEKSADSVPEITARIYIGIPEDLIGAARRNVFAHLIDLAQKGVITPAGPIRTDAHFRLR